jgi:DNA-binding winged helix-turn-helix (wHTH) protein
MSVDFGERVSLASSPVLRSLLAALAERHLRSPRAVCPRPELLEAAWPGVRLRPSVLRNRLNVALSKLRKLGLGELLEHAEDGYRFAPGTVVHRA